VVWYSARVDEETREMLAEWVSHHLSNINYDFVWEYWYNKVREEGRGVEGKKERRQMRR
jgi:predicted thioredoxin/glutaredoxin